MTFAEIRDLPLAPEVARMVYAADQALYYVIPAGSTVPVPVGVMPPSAIVAFIISDPAIRAWLDSLYG